ncbi:MAG: cation:proton antiporter [Parcubacteria group bacterium]
MSEVFLQLGLILGCALAISAVMKFLRQPLIIGYILTGLLVGPAVFGFIQKSEMLESFGHIGVALLLFVVGLGLKPSVIKEIGKTAFLTGVGQLLFTGIVGYGIARWVGLTPLVSIYLSFGFALSSTIIMSRLLQAKGEQEGVYGRVSIGFLLVQDVAVLLLFLIISSSQNVGTGEFLPTVALILLKLALVLISLWVMLRFIVPHVDKFFANSRELLLLFGLGVCFAVAGIFYKLNFSVELGALAAGVILSTSPYQREIAVRLQSVRDFFLIIFFILLGTNIYLSDVFQYVPLIVIFSLFIIIGNPLILFLIMRALKYTVKTSFFVGLVTAQISEFTLVLVAMGISAGHLSSQLLGPVTVVGIITMAASTYMVTYNHRLYGWLRRPLHAIFHDKSINEQEIINEPVEVIVFGCHRLGGGLVRTLQKRKIKFLVVDHDPDAVKFLAMRNIPCLFGSADNLELLECLSMKNCRLAISTIPDIEVNAGLVAFFKKRKRGIDFLCIANHGHEAERLYRLGATYVIMPHYLGRRFMADLFLQNELGKRKYRVERAKHVADLAGEQW